VSAPSERSERGGGFATTALFAFAAGLFGLVGGLPGFAGPAVGIGGVVVSSVWRGQRATRGGWRTAFSVAPALLAIAVLALTAPPVDAAELFGGLTGLSFLLWLADDPARASGGGRRAAPTIALAALAVGLAWAISLSLPTGSAEIGVAAGLLTAAILLLAILLGRPQALVTRTGPNA